VSEVADDALKTRIARFVATIGKSQSVNGDSDVCLGTSLGMVRKQNQDRALIAFAKYSYAPERSFTLGVVCDGIGGLAKGDEAAVLALSTFVSRVLRTPKQNPTDRLRSGALAANNAVHQAFRGRSGATISAVMIRRGVEVVGLNIGDSRIYGITKSRELQQLSRDDTLAQALGHPRPLDLHTNQLIQFVGMGNDIEPHTFSTNDAAFDSLLLTSDGIHNMPPDTLTQAARVPSSNANLVERLLMISDALGGRDNATAVSVPIRLDPLNGQPQQGLSLEFWSVSDRLEIWMPMLADDYRQPSVPHSFAEVTEVILPERNDIPSKRSHRAEGQTKRKKRQSKNRPHSLSDDTDRLPLDVTFPNKRE
jgi:serine/threonine protein phosphatase PrpC